MFTLEQLWTLWSPDSVQRRSYSSDLGVWGLPAFFPSSSSLSIKASVAVSQEARPPWSESRCFAALSLYARPYFRRSARLLEGDSWSRQVALTHFVVCAFFP